MGLTVSRRAGDNITITIKSIYGGKASISVDAPRHIPVDRAEVRASKVGAARGVAR